VLGFASTVVFDPVDISAFVDVSIIRRCDGLLGYGCPCGKVVLEQLLDDHVAATSAQAGDYEALDAQATELEAQLRAELTPEERSRLRERLERVRRQHAEVARIDFFDAPEGRLLASRLARIAQALSAGDGAAAPTAPAAIEAYRETRWVTRPRPHVDRLSCIWLIRRFINPQAVVRYSSAAAPGEVGFDMPRREAVRTVSVLIMLKTAWSVWRCSPTVALTAVISPAIGAFSSTAGMPVVGSTARGRAASCFLARS